MSEIINQNSIQESTGSEKKEGRPGFELPQKSAEGIVSELSTLNDLVSHDKAVTFENIENVDNALRGMNVEEIEQIPDLKRNMEIWQEIRQGNFDNMQWLTYLSDEMAEEFSKMGHHSALFSRVTILSDKAIGLLVKTHYAEICFGISVLSNVAAKHLGGAKSEINLYKLMTLSLTAALELSKVNDSLYLRGLKFISDEVAEALGKHKGELILDGIETITDEGVRYLCENQGELRLGGLKALSDKAAEYLGKRKDPICLRNLMTISENAAEYLAQNDSSINGAHYSIEHPLVRDQIRKYMKS